MHDQGPPVGPPEESFEDLYQHAPCGYISTLPDGTFAKVNRTFLTWTGYGPEALLGVRRFQDLLTTPGKIFYETHYAPLLRMQGALREIALDMRGSDGRLLPVLVNAVQHTDPAGAPLLIRAVIFDARDRRQYERELLQARERAERALGLRDQFLLLAAQELRTPLSAIMGNVELLHRRLTRQYPLDTREQRMFQVIADQTNRLDTMINALLDVSRIETGQLAIQLRPLDLCGLLRRLADELQTSLRGRVIAVRCENPSVRIRGDELRLEQVFQNLLHNALQYSPPELPVEVEIRPHGTYVDVVVRDQGIGIPAADLPNLFQRFFRASNVPGGMGSGMGIGLHVVKAIVTLHGGQVTVESAEGQGSTFTVSLPINPA